MDDPKSMMDFYKNVFGWEMNQMGADMNNYVVVMTSETDEKTRRPKNPGMIDGGMYKKDASMGDMHPSFVIAVDDIQEHIKKITDAGGKITTGPDDIPGVGIYASFSDPSGNRLSILQPAPRMSK